MSETRVVSCRLPASVDRALRISAANARWALSDTLNWLLVYSFGNAELLRSLNDSREQLNSKLDARIPSQTVERLKIVSEKLGISPSVYIRRLSYHFYITKRVRYLKVDGRYTLAGMA